ncbi:hypothetical protein JCM1841_004249 [Sporobolomyces salmonicolor]
MAPGKVRTSSTKGRHIVQVNPLPKGQSCSTCRQRKVRCDAGKPACRACLRTARFEGRDFNTVVCQYDGKPCVRGAAKKRKVSPGRKASHDGEVEILSDVERVKRERSEGLRYPGADDVGPSNHYALPLPDFYLSASLRLPNLTRSDSYESATSPSTQHLSSSRKALPYAVTPPLSCSSASSPEGESFAHSPPASTASSAFDSWTPAVAPPDAQSSSSSTPQLYTLPPMYAPQSVFTSTPMSLPPPQLDSSTYFEALRMSLGGNSTYPQLAPLPSSPYPQHCRPTPDGSSFVRPSPAHAYPTPPISSSPQPPPHRPAPSSSRPLNDNKPAMTFRLPPPLPLPSVTLQAAYLPEGGHYTPYYPSAAYFAGGGAGPAQGGGSSSNHPADPTFSLPLGYPSPGGFKDMSPASSAATPGFSDVDSWLRGLAA